MKLGPELGYRELYHSAEIFSNGTSLNVKFALGIKNFNFVLTLSQMCVSNVYSVPSVSPASDFLCLIRLILELENQELSNLQ